MTERWLPVVGYEGAYEVSDQGRVRSVDRLVHRRGLVSIRLRGMVLRPALRDGYLFVALSGTSHRVHRLVLAAFVGPAAPGEVACHWNDDGTDNRLTNLRWGSRVTNAVDAIRNGRNRNRNKTHCKRGHMFSPENTYVDPSGRRRSCRICKRAKERQRDRDRKAA